MLYNIARLFGACLLCAYTCANLRAQDCHLALRGHIIDADTKEPLAYASIIIKDARKGTTSDENGYFSIPNLCESTPYTVDLSHVECAHSTQIVKLTENQEVNFQLKHNAALHEVIVSEKAVALQSTQAENVVAHADLEASKGVNLGETLKKLPGVSILSTGATISKPVIQGLHSNRIAIINNGVALEGQQWGSEHAPEIDPFTADKISVVKGAAGVRYGVGAIGGAVVLEPAVLREKTGVGGWLALGGFSNGYGGVASGSVDWHLPGRSLTFRLQGTAKRSGNLKAPDYWLGNTGVSELNGSFRAGWKSAHWQHEIGVTAFDQKLGILRASHIGNLTDLLRAIDSPVPLNNPDSFSYKINRPFQSAQHFVLKYKAEFRISEKWKFSSQYSGQFNNRREYDVVRQSSSAAIENKPQLSFRLWTNTLDLALEHFPIHHWQGGVGVQAIQQYNLVGRGGLIPDYESYGGSVWAMERWRRYPLPLEFEAGVRYDYRQTHAVTSGTLHNIDTLVHYGNASGTLGAIYHISKNITASLNSGYAWRPPNINELFARGVHHGAGTYEEGNRNLRPEQAWNTNLNLQFEAPQWQNLSGQITVYRNYIRDFIYLDPQKTFVLTSRGAFPAYFYKQSNAVLKGLDGSFSLDLIDHLSFEGRISLLRAFRLADGDSTETSSQKAHDWLPLMPSDRYQYGLKWTFGGKNHDLKAAESGKENSFIRLSAGTTLRQTRIPADGLLKDAPSTYTTFSFDAGHTFMLHGKQLEVGLNIQNLTNVRYREYLNFFRYYTDEPGFSAAVRAKLIFG
ncbi:MAG: TonB-dependent receptor [Bacteroidota bacterium]